MGNVYNLSSNKNDRKIICNEFCFEWYSIEFVYNYNMTTDCIDVPSQTVGVYQGYNVLLYPGIPGGNFYADDSAVFKDVLQIQIRLQLSSLM